MSLAQGALRSIALLDPGLVMPDIIERAYGGLEVVNETHRTTAVLSTLGGVALPLVSEKIWLGGQKHVLPLLELSLPGIDLVCSSLQLMICAAPNFSLQNDPTKTVCATMFITAIVQAGIKIGDLTNNVGLALASDAPGDEMMVVDEEDITIPEGTEPGGPALSREEERALVRDSTTGFAGMIFQKGALNFSEALFVQIGWFRFFVGSFRYLRTFPRKEENGILFQSRKSSYSSPSRRC